jgi:hypothetical protein
MPRSSYWTNSDGLVVGFGTRSIETNSGAQPRSDQMRQQVKVQIKGSTIPDSDVSAQLVHGVTIPANALLESAKLFVTTAFAGATAVLDVGTYDSAGAAVDDDGLMSAVAVATLVDNAVVTGAGALIGTVLASNQRIGVSYDTAAFTAGEAWLVVEYIPAG